MEHEFGCAKLKLGAQIQLLRDEIERQFKRVLTQTVEAHENDRKKNFERYTSRVSLDYSPEVFDRLKGWIRGQFPCYISGFQYSQGGSFSINFTNCPPLGVWEPIVVDMNEIIDQADNLATDVQKPTAASTGSQTSESRSTTPSSTYRPTNHRSPQRRKPPRPKKTTILPSTGTKKKPKRPTKKGSEHLGGKVMRTSVATRKISETPSWAFSYDLGEGFRYYVLRCPTPGCRFSFSVDPFKDNLAIAHFEECNVSYSDEVDIVRRYACQLKRQRPGPESTEVSEVWIEEYNQKVSRERERRRLMEGRSATNSLVVADESSTESTETSPREAETMQG
ncbi:hypothetical protein LZ31DRAFT_548894 [Colletotrichum somersetense]|nr:hypothetical protein LZ31DRAFT_548894 [Colletotrichum somersetense]